MPKQPATPQTKDSLLATAQELAHHAEALRSYAALVELHGLDPLMVTHGDQRRRGMMYLDNFVAAAKAAVREACEKKGVFGGEPAS